MGTVKYSKDKAIGFVFFLYKNFVKLLAKVVRLMYNTIKEMYNACTR